MKIRRISFILALSLVVMFIFNKVRFHYGWRNAFFRTVLAGFEATRWAPEFSLDAFEQADCDALGECIWIYSWQITGTDDFDQRWIVFNPKGKVSEVTISFFID